MALQKKSGLYRDLNQKPFTLERAALSAAPAPSFRTSTNTLPLNLVHEPCLVASNVSKWYQFHHFSPWLPRGMTRDRVEFTRGVLCSYLFIMATALSYIHDTFTTRNGTRNAQAKQQTIVVLGVPRPHATWCVPVVLTTG